jgi:hypothetical protein
MFQDRQNVVHSNVDGYRDRYGQVPSHSVQENAADGFF